jgi:hypothetical protein
MKEEKEERNVHVVHVVSLLLGLAAPLARLFGGLLHLLAHDRVGLVSLEQRMERVLKCQHGTR